MELLNRTAAHRVPDYHRSHGPCGCKGERFVGGEFVRRSLGTDGRAGRDRHLGHAQRTRIAIQLPGNLEAYDEVRLGGGGEWNGRYCR